MEKKAKSQSGKNPETGLSYESAFKKLEETAYRLEKGDTGLEESITLFEEGIRLSRQCHELLEKAERRIEILQKGAGGTVEPRRVKVKADTGEAEDDEELQGSLL